MKDDEDTPAASGDLLTAAAATARAAATEAAMAAAAAEVAMVATETEPAEAAEVVQAHSLPLPSLRTNQPFSHRLSCHTFVYAGASGAQEGRDHFD